jgi:hypothetical protein
MAIIPAVAAFLVAASPSSAGAAQDPVETAKPAKTMGAPELALPIRCQPGRDCWLVNYVDMDPGPGRRDYACGKKTYDGHKGTDIAIRDLEAMKKGVAVVAAAGGVVRGARDGMEDIDFTRKGASEIKGRECGNGVVIDHGGGWETQYCHMRRGSVAVRTGDSVKRGRKLGLVGHSGRAQFPHVHLSVRLNKQIVDPFAGPVGKSGRKKKCGLGPSPLWRKSALAALGGGTTALYNAGFSGKRPEPRAVRAGLLGGGRLSPKAPALVLWVDMFWGEAGDQLNFRITGPKGKPLTRRTIPITKTQARRFVFVGTKKKQGLWPPGTYRGEITLVRGKGTAEALTLSVTRKVEVR